MFSIFIACKRTTKSNNATHYVTHHVKLGKKRRESFNFQTQLLHYFSKSDNKSNHHHRGETTQVHRLPKWQYLFGKRGLFLWGSFAKEIWELGSLPIICHFIVSSQFCQSQWICFCSLRFYNIWKKRNEVSQICPQCAAVCCSVLYCVVVCCRHEGEFLRSQEKCMISMFTVRVTYGLLVNDDFRVSMMCFSREDISFFQPTWT